MNPDPRDDDGNDAAVKAKAKTKTKAKAAMPVKKQPGGYTWVHPNAHLMGGSESEDSDMQSDSGDDTDEAEARRERRAEKLRKRRFVPYQKPKAMTAAQLRRKKLAALGKKHVAEDVTALF